MPVQVFTKKLRYSWFYNRFRAACFEIRPNFLLFLLELEFQILLVNVAQATVFQGTPRIREDKRIKLLVLNVVKFAHLT